MADGHIVDQRTFTYGASFTEADYPELPQKDGYFAEWSTPVLDDLHLDTVVTALYTSYIPALKSMDVRTNGRPIFYVDGLFGGSNALSVTSQTPSGVANATEQWLLDFSDDGQETPPSAICRRASRAASMSSRMANGSKCLPIPLAATSPLRLPGPRSSWPLCPRASRSGSSAAAR